MGSAKAYVRATTHDEWEELSETPSWVQITDAQIEGEWAVGSATFMVSNTDPSTWNLDSVPANQPMFSSAFDNIANTSRSWLDVEWHPDATSGASVDDLIDNIDAVLESYRSDG